MLVISCPLCPQQRVQDNDIPMAIGSLLSHLIGEHWEELQKMREFVVKDGPVRPGAWTRI